MTKIFAGDVGGGLVSVIVKLLGPGSVHVMRDSNRQFIDLLRLFRTFENLLKEVRMSLTDYKKFL